MRTQEVYPQTPPPGLAFGLNRIPISFLETGNRFYFISRLRPKPSVITVTYIQRVTLAVLTVTT